MKHGRWPVLLVTFLFVVGPLSLAQIENIVIPAGTGHWFTKIDDHITYLMVRVDPDKVVPLKSEAQSKAHLASPYTPGQGNF